MLVLCGRHTYIIPGFRRSRKMSSLGSAWAIYGLSQTPKRMHANSVDLCLIGSDWSEPQEVLSPPHFFYSMHQLVLTRKHCSWSVCVHCKSVPIWIFRRTGVSEFTCGDQRKTSGMGLSFRLGNQGGDLGQAVLQTVLPGELPYRARFPDIFEEFQRKRGEIGLFGRKHDQKKIVIAPQSYCLIFHFSVF